MQKGVWWLALTGHCNKVNLPTSVPVALWNGAEQWRRQGGDWGDESPPQLFQKTNFDIFLNLLRKLGGGDVAITKD